MKCFESRWKEEVTEPAPGKPHPKSAREGKDALKITQDSQGSRTDNGRSQNIPITQTYTLQAGYWIVFLKKLNYNKKKKKQNLNFDLRGLVTSCALTAMPLWASSMHLHRASGPTLNQWLANNQHILQKTQSLKPKITNFKKINLRGRLQEENLSLVSFARWRHRWWGDRALLQDWRVGRYSYSKGKKLPWKLKIQQ